MRIQEIKTIIPLKKTFKVTPKYFNLNSQQTDSFERQNSQINFNGLRKPKKSNDENSEIQKIEKNIADSMKSIPLAGTSFLLSLATSAAMVKMGDNAKDLLMDDAGYIVSKNGIKSDLINIDRARGIINFSGTGINIDTDTIDIADWENGIFRNYDRSVDIDLLNNKFIDKKNGIFVDPISKISAVADKDRLQPIAVVSFGSGYPTNPNDDRWLTMPQLEEVEQGSPFGLLGEFIRNLFKKDTQPNVENVKDIFDNEVILAKDDDGDLYFAPVMKSVQENPTFQNFLNGLNKEETTETINNLRLKQYMDEFHPSFGTRIMVYEGGRNATGSGLFFDQFEWKYDKNLVNATLEKLRQDASYIPEKYSEEAKSFALYQNQRLRLNDWHEPKIDPELLIGKNTDLDGDSIFDFDRTGDGFLNYSSHGKPREMSAIKFLFQLIDKDGSGSIDKAEFINFIKEMDLNKDGTTSIIEMAKYIKNILSGN